MDIAINSPEKKDNKADRKSYLDEDRQTRLKNQALREVRRVREQQKQRSGKLQRRRDSLARDGAMFVGKPINREEDGDILFA